MADNKKGEEKSDDSLWKDLIEKVKQENRVATVKSIEEPPTKVGLDIPKPIEKPAIDEIPIEKPLEEPASVEKIKLPAKRAVKKSGKFTTIMITKDLKKRLSEKKEAGESFGDMLERLLKEK
ncbi:MAG: antitoxin VapB family protein [Candidatus Aenigmatarchaeota archaeon]